MHTRTPFWKPLSVAALVAVGIGAAGGALTRLDTWYFALEKPWWKPPDVAFGPVWTTIFTLCAVAAALAWRARPDSAYRRTLLLAFAANAVFNIGWSAFFFRLQRPDWAAVDVVLLWASIVWLIVVLARASRLAAALLVPYLAWVSVAAVLTFWIVRANGPFGGA